MYVPTASIEWRAKKKRKDVYAPLSNVNIGQIVITKQKNGHLEKRCLYILFNIVFSFNFVNHIPSQHLLQL